MSSIKNRKSKSKGREGIAGQIYLDGAYDLSRRAFMDTPPAKTVRPMRVIKKRVSDALEALQRSLAFASKAGTTFDQARALTEPQAAGVRNAMNLYKAARAAAKAGDGRTVAFLA